MIGKAPDKLIDGIREVTETGVKWKDSGNGFYALGATLIMTKEGGFKIKLETGEEFEAEIEANDNTVSSLHDAIRRQLGLIKPKPQFTGNVLAGQDQNS